MKNIVVAGVCILMMVFTACSFLGPCIQGYGPIMVDVRDLDGFTAVSNTGSFEVRVTQADSFAVEVEAQENLLQFIETYVSGGTLIVKTRNGECINSIAPILVYVSLPELTEIRNTGSGKLSADRADSNEFEITNSGSGKISIDSVFALSAALKNSGSGDLSMLAAYVNEIQAVQTGSGKIDAGAVYGAALLDVNHTSSGSVYGTLIDGVKVDARLTGSGRITLWGNAETADYYLSASGKIDAVELMVEDAEVSISGSGKVYVYATDFLDVTISASGDVIYRGNPMITTRITGSGSVRPY